MAKVITDKKKIDELLTRGVEEILPEQKELRDKLLSGKQLRIKLGIDPTSPHLHIGRSIPLLKLRDFQELGHKIILIIGDATGVVGDTSDKESERPMLSKEQINKNLKAYAEQAGKILDMDKVELRRNSEWLNKLRYAEIGEHADVFSVADFIARDNIKRRINAGKRVSLREVLYPLMQGYDSVAIEADVELGGTDQRFNLLAGRELQRAYKQEPQSVVMTGLINGLDGRKMSSSWGNTVNILDQPIEMYGKIMSMHDDLLMDYFIYCTRIPMKEVQGYQKQLDKGANPRDIKKDLARIITAMYHSEEIAQEAQTHWETQFSQGGVPKDIPEHLIESPVEIMDLLKHTGLVKSGSEARRKLDEGAVQLDGKKVKKIKIKLSREQLEKGVVLKLGRKMLRIKIKKKEE
ncbi:MAG: tyrosine--tRNA ligase [Patescibacteria group bacterium]